MEEVQIESLAADHAVGLWRNVIIGMWRAQPRVKGVKEYHDLSVRVHARFPRGHVVALVIAERSSPPPDSDARALFAKVMKDFNGHTRATAVAAEGGSLSASVVRGVLTGLLIVVKHETPTKMFGHGRDAAVWLKGQLDAAGAPSFDVKDLNAAVDSLRARMDALERQHATA